jgi:hypothetical protein
MPFLYYITIYLGIGTLIMVILDILHRLVKDVVDEEFKEGYENWERIYIILTWPIFMFSLIRSIIKNK